MTMPDPAPTCETLIPTPVDISLVTDYADLGTAFGLDASVASADTAAPRVETVEPSGATVQPAVPWEHRLTRRNGL